MILTPEKLQRAVEALVERAVEGGHIMREPAPSVHVETMPDGTPRALITATLVGRVNWIPGVLTPPAALRRCCERDHDGDGNCDRHPGKYAARMASEARKHEPRPGDCYARRWYNVERPEEQRHVRVRMLGMGEDKQLVGVSNRGTFTDHIMTRAAFDEEFVRCPAEKHDHQR